MPASTRRFGIEFEFATGGRSQAFWGNVLRTALSAFPNQHLNVGGYFHSDGRTWDLKTDSSCGYELATPALTWMDWPVIEAVLTALRGAGARVNNRTGLHVHHECRDFGDRGIRRMVTLWARNEAALVACCLPRRANNGYCETIAHKVTYDVSPSARVVDAMQTATGENLRRLGVNGVGRSALNLSHFWSRATIEVRLFHGTLNLTDVKAWVLLTQNIVEEAASTRPGMFRALPATTDGAKLMRRLLLTARLTGRNVDAECARAGRRLAAKARVRNAQFFGATASRVAVRNRRSRAFATSVLSSVLS